MTKQSTKNKQERETLENILRLEPLRNKLEGTDLQRLDSVLENLQKNVGSTVSKSNAAEILKVSRQTVDRWVNEGLLPVTKRKNGRQAIPRDAFQRVANEVNGLKDVAKTRNFIADTLHSLAGEIAPKKKSRAAAAKKAQTTSKQGNKKSANTARKTTGKKKGSTAKSSQGNKGTKKAAK
jgi:hypothetical protein